MKAISKSIFLTLFSISTFCAQSQDFYRNYVPAFHFDSTAAGAVSLHFYSNNFVRNNEYFGPYTAGITYLGSILQPEATWALGKDFSISAGWYFRLYFGQDGFEKSIPVIRIRYNVKPGMQVIMGQLDGRLSHGYIEPIFNTDNYFIKNPEYGVQFLVNKKRLHTDLYMDWERFLMPGETHQEIITGGLLASYACNKIDNNRGLSLHFQSVIHHFGGQVDNSDNPLQSRSNLAVGFRYSVLPASKLLKKISLSSFYIQALELSQTNTIPFNSGFGVHSVITFENDWIKLNSGWFHGEYFFAPLGDYLFLSISQFNDWYVGEKKDLVTSKLLIGHQIMKGVDFGIRFESYYDLKQKRNDFSYGLNVSVNAKVFEKMLSLPN